MAEPPTGVRVDFIFSTTPYEREAIRRAASVEVAGAPRRGLRRIALKEVARR